MNRLVIVLVLLLFQTAFSQEDKINFDLRFGPKQERIARLARMGIDRELAEAALERSEGPEIEFHSMRDGRGPRLASLVLPCKIVTTCLFALDKDKDDAHVTDKVEFQWFGEPISVDVARIGPDLDELLVHNVSEGHGTGIDQHDFKVLRIVRGKLKTVLDTRESEWVARVPIGSYVLNQRSQFVIVPEIHSQWRVLEETRSTDVNGELKVERRYFVWNHSEGKYLPSGFEKIEYTKAVTHSVSRSTH